MTRATSPSDRPRQQSEKSAPGTWRRGRPGAMLAKVHIEVVAIDGADGNQLRALQTEAVREALRWSADHPSNADGQTEAMP